MDFKEGLMWTNKYGFTKIYTQLINEGATPHEALCELDIL